MSPRKRIDRSRRRRRRAWAAPFVVTAALSAPGCVVKEGPPPDSPDQTHERQTDHRAQPQPDRQAPPPERTHDREEPPKVVTNPPPPEANNLPEAPDEGGTVHTRKDGTCWWVVEVDCPENATCNPPPPRQVQCPDE